MGCTKICLAIPGLVLEVEGDKAIVDFGGIKREVMLTLIDSREVKSGKTYVIVHTGFAISIVSRKEAEESLKLWKEILESPEFNV